MNKKFNIITLTILTLASTFGVVAAQPVYADSNTQTFHVTVNNPNSVRVKFTNPADKKQLSTNSVNVSYSCINIDSATLKITNQITGDFDTDTYTPTTSNETATATFNFNSIGGYGVYILNVTGSKAGVLTPSEDTISVTYSPTPIQDITIDPTGNNDPIIVFDTPIDRSVDHVEIQVYSEPGHTPMFDPAIIVPRSEIEDGSYTLPFNDREIPTGDYTIGVSAYDVDNNFIYETLSDLFHYTAPIRVPDTGAFLKEIGMSGTSFALILTATFIAVSIALFIIVKRKKNEE